MEYQGISSKKTIRVLLIRSLIISTILFGLYIYPSITYCPPHDICEKVPIIFIVLAFITPWIITFMVISTSYYLYLRLYRNNAENQAIFNKKTVCMLLKVSFIISLLLVLYTLSQLTKCPPDAGCAPMYFGPFLILIIFWIITFIMLSILYYLYRRLYQKLATKRSKNEI